VVDAGIGVGASPLWSDPSTLVLSTAASTAGPGQIVLVNLPVGARYTLPGAPAGSVATAVSPAGTRLAITTTGGGVLIAPAGGASGATQALPGRLDALGFIGEGTLMAFDPTASQLVRVSVAGGDTTAVSLLPGLADLSTVRVAPDGRRIVCLALDASGVLQVYVANADGSGALALTLFIPGAALVAQAVDFGD
jgi:hypothetical protein